MINHLISDNSMNTSESKCLWFNDFNQSSSNWFMKYFKLDSHNDLKIREI